MKASFVAKLFSAFGGSTLRRSTAIFALILSTAVAAHATPITGAASIGGTDTYDATQITFNPSTGVVTGASGTLAPYLFNTATLTSFAFASAANVQVFTVVNGLDTLSFTISSLTSYGLLGNGDLSVKGNGVFKETGYEDTLGTFSLTSTSASSGGAENISFTLSSAASPAATPEPSSLVLLATGLLGAAGIVRRKIVQA